MKRYFLLAPLALMLAFLGGCIYNDPSPDELRKAENIDIERMHGTILSKDIMYYIGDRQDTAEKKGQPYYRITIEDLAGKNEIFRGVPVNVFDSLAVGMKLPQAPLLTMQQLAKMEGRIADKIPFIETDGFKFFIVIDDYAAVKLCRVDMATYYSKKVVVGASLPLALDE